MKIKSYMYALMAVALFMGTIWIFQAAGVWSTSGKVTSSGQQVEPSSEDVDSVKGWMTLEQVSTAFDVPNSEILAEFDLPPDTPADTALKDLESDSFDIPALRTWLGER